ncbi:MAG TPA: hypothetical protein VL022_10015 [Moheibacter sp.]|nr:hypothetical protein [Moheibacter sp.]
MKLAFWLFYLLIAPMALETDPETKKEYQLHLEAQGCHYQIMVNGEKLEEGKTYQKIERTYQLNKELTDETEQVIDVNMFQISREMPLKATQAYIHLTLEKKENDSIIFVKKVKLPTFPYDEDEAQPQSIGGSIYFER